MIKSKLIKLESISDLPEDKIYVKEGDILNGVFEKWPEVGKNFVFIIRPELSRFSGKLPINTSVVEELIDDRTFRTRNSIYKIVTLDDEREDKIKIILE